MNHQTRNNQWLEDQLNHVWQTYFTDVPPVNKVIIKFGRASRRQLGSITATGPRRRLRRPGRFPKESWWLPESVSTITITSLFQNPTVPEIVIKTVIAHELVHYAHGFCSPHPQLFRYPHQGRIVYKELIDRGLDKELKYQQEWLKKNWRKDGGMCFR